MLMVTSAIHWLVLAAISLLDPQFFCLAQFMLGMQHMLILLRLR